MLKRLLFKSRLAIFIVYLRLRQSVQEICSNVIQTAHCTTAMLILVASVITVAVLKPMTALQSMMLVL